MALIHCICKPPSTVLLVTSYLCGVSDRGQLQVLGVAPAKEASVSRHSQATITVGGHLDNTHAGEVSTQPGGYAGDIVVTQTWQNINICV